MVVIIIIITKKKKRKEKPTNRKICRVSIQLQTTFRNKTSSLIKINTRTIIIKLMNHESKVLDEILINRTFT